MINVLTTSKFSKIIMDLAQEKEISYMDAIMDYCDKNNLKKQIKEEATVLNFMKQDE